MIARAFARSPGRLLAVAVIAIASVAVGSFATAVSFGERAERPRAIIAFHQAETDQAVAAFLQRNTLDVEAVYTWTAGFSGVHRAYRPKMAAELVAEARQETMRLFGNALASNLTQIQQFTLAYSDGEVAASDVLAGKARSILNNRLQVLAALAAASGADGLVYAVEVVDASPETLMLVSQDPFVSAVASRAGSKTGGSLKPVSYEAVWQDPSVFALPVDRLHGEMVAIARSSGSQR